MAARFSLIALLFLSDEVLRAYTLSFASRRTTENWVTGTARPCRGFGCVSERCPATRLWVSIGLGPSEEEQASIPAAETPVSHEEAEAYDPDDTSNDPPGSWTSRMSSLDLKCDEWFTSLLGPVSSTNFGTALPTAITSSVHEKLFHTVKPSDTEDPKFPRWKKDMGEQPEEWTPYGSRRLPRTAFTPPMGLENYGIPVLRRGSEAWRQFDVAGMVEVNYSGRPQGLGTDLLLDEETTEVYKEALSSDGSWLDDDSCFARLVYINGRFCPDLSKDAPIVENSGTAAATIRNVNAMDADAEAWLLRKETAACLGRLPDGFSDELPSEGGKRPARLYSKLSGPDHKVGSPRSPFAMNSQQGTAAFAALNTLRAESVTLVDIPAGGQIEKPILILFAYTVDGAGHATAEDRSGEGFATHPRVVVTGGEGCVADVIQSLVDLNVERKGGKGTLPRLHNGYTQFFVHAGANITHHYIDESGGMVVPGVEDDEGPDETVSARKKESERPALLHTVLECIDVHVTGEKGSYSGSMIGVGGSGRARVAMYASLLALGAHAEVNGLMLSGGAQRGDMRTTIHHVEKECTSRQAQRNMVGGRATATFKGRIRVEKEAQLTDSDQLSRTILLTDKSRIWSIPSLEIIADDVKCTHGATVSDLSEEELFYLRSRGLNVATSRNLLMYAFVDEVSRSVNTAILGDDSSGLKKRISDRLLNLVPKGQRAIMGEFQSV